MVKFIEHDSECPDISLWSIGVFDDTFGGHVEGRSDVEIAKISSRILRVRTCSEGRIQNQQF